VDLVAGDVQISVLDPERLTVVHLLDRVAEERRRRHPDGVRAAELILERRLDADLRTVRLIAPVVVELVALVKDLAADGLGRRDEQVLRRGHLPGLVLAELIGHEDVRGVSPRPERCRG
jgi:hypothetical protein